MSNLTAWPFAITSDTLRIHPVISIQHVEKCADPGKDPWKRSENDLTEPGPVGNEDPRPRGKDVDTTGGNDIYECTIMDEKRTKSGRFKYKVHWTGWQEKYDEWLSPSRISDSALAAWSTRQKSTQSYAAEQVG